MKQNPIICVDFDGVIHSYTSGWKGIDCIPDPPVPGAIEWLLAHLPVPDALGIAPEYVGPEVVIYSSRSKEAKGIKAMKQWFVLNGVDEWYFKDDILKFPAQKPAAFLTLDDRAICFDGRFPTTEEMLSFIPWNKRAVGPTRQFPDGKIHETDEGEIRLAVTHHEGNVVINFGTPVAWLGFPKEQALQLALVIAKHASELP